jgi:hypothetical protein
MAGAAGKKILLVKASCRKPLRSKELETWRTAVDSLQLLWLGQRAIRLLRRGLARGWSGTGQGRRNQYTEDRLVRTRSCGRRL